MDDRQKQAYEFVASLLTFYGPYRKQKEREAYLITVLFLGATGALLTSKTLPSRATLVLLLAGIGIAALLVAAFVLWQFMNLRFAARIVLASFNVRAQWLTQPPSNDRLAAIPLPRSKVCVPADVKAEFCKQRAYDLLLAEVVVPLLILAWGGLVIVVLGRCS